MGAAPGNDVKLAEDRVRGYKNFANKIWNISRFVIENTEGADERTPLSSSDEALVAEARDVARNISTHLDIFRLDLAADAAYHFVWDRFAAQILEESKAILKGTDTQATDSRKAALLAILKKSLALLHPFMPYVTEEIWSELPG